MGESVRTYANTAWSLLLYVGLGQALGGTYDVLRIMVKG